MLGGANDDSLLGGDGNDQLNGNEGNDTLLGGAGDDTLYSSSGFDLLDGGADNDTYDLTMGAGGNSIHETSGGNDVLYVRVADADFGKTLFSIDAGSNLAIHVRDSSQNELVSYTVWNMNLVASQVETLKIHNSSDYVGKYNLIMAPTPPSSAAPRPNTRAPPLQPVSLLLARTVPTPSPALSSCSLPTKPSL